MKWSMRLGRFAGIDVYVHATFSLLLLYVGLVYWQETRSLAATASGIAFILALFVCVVLHEFGHALTARRYGIKTRDITLLPIGGLARLEKMPDEPIQEFWVAIAGPAVNVVIAAVLFLIIGFGPGFHTVEEVSAAGGSFIERLMAVNIMLVLFNLLPAFPMDGGRVLRALLATRMPYVRATNIAAGIGQAMAFIFGFAGLFLLKNPFLLFIALFVWIGASQEASAATMKLGMQGIPVHQAMIIHFHCLSPADPLARVVELILSGSQHDYPVCDDGGVVGILTRTELMRALAKRDQGTPVSEVMTRKFVTLNPDEPLMAAMPKLQESEVPIAPVVSNGELVGLLTLENVGEFLMIRSAMQTAGAAPSV
jgi:Zn-dependent protease